MPPCARININPTESWLLSTILSKVAILWFIVLFTYHVQSLAVAEKFKVYGISVYQC